MAEYPIMAPVSKNGKSKTYTVVARHKNARDRINVGDAIYDLKSGNEVFTVAASTKGKLINLYFDINDKVDSLDILGVIRKVEIFTPKRFFDLYKNMKFTIKAPCGLKYSSEAITVNSWRLDIGDFVKRGSGLGSVRGSDGRFWFIDAPFDGVLINRVEAGQRVDSGYPIALFEAVTFNRKWLKRRATSAWLYAICSLALIILIPSAFLVGMELTNNYGFVFSALPLFLFFMSFWVYYWWALPLIKNPSDTPSTRIKEFLYKNKPLFSSHTNEVKLFLRKLFWSLLVVFLIVMFPIYWHGFKKESLTRSFSILHSGDAQFSYNRAEGSFEFRPANCTAERNSSRGEFFYDFRNVMWNTSEIYEQGGARTWRVECSDNCLSVDDCQSASNRDPLSASNIDPSGAELARRCVVLM